MMTTMTMMMVIMNSIGDVEIGDDDDNDGSGSRTTTAIRKPIWHFEIWTGWHGCVLSRTVDLD